MNSKIAIKGKLINLRPLKLSDAERFCKWLADPEVTKFLSVHGLKPPTVKEEREWITEARKARSKVNLAIDAADGEHIGSISLRLNAANNNAIFGIVIGNKKYWGQGCGTEATYLMCKYGFDKLKLHRIELDVIAFNFRGIKAYQKVGFKNEGTRRDHVWRDGYWHDQHVMGLLKPELKKLTF